MTLSSLRSCRSANSYILASTEELHARIDMLLERTRDLEVALDASYSLHSTQTHGLLKKDLLVEGSRLALERDHDEEEEVPVAAFGTLKSKWPPISISTMSVLPWLIHCALVSQKTGGAEWVGSTGSSYFFVQDVRSILFHLKRAHRHHRGMAHPWHHQ